MTYTLLNLIFIAPAVIIAIVAYQKNEALFRQSAWLFVPLILMSIFFNNILTSIPIITYDTTKLSGLYLGSAPAEDFAYTLVLVILIPALWSLIREK